MLKIFITFHPRNESDFPWLINARQGTKLAPRRFQDLGKIYGCFCWDHQTNKLLRQQPTTNNPQDTTTITTPIYTYNSYNSYRRKWWNEIKWASCRIKRAPANMFLTQATRDDSMRAVRRLPWFTMSRVVQQNGSPKPNEKIGEKPASCARRGTSTLPSPGVSKPPRQQRSALHLKALNTTGEAIVWQIEMRLVAI